MRDNVRVVKRENMQNRILEMRKAILILVVINLVAQQNPQEQPEQGNRGRIDENFGIEGGMG